MKNKTEIATEVGKHAFEVAGLGKAPFFFVGAAENRIQYPDGSSKAGGTCAFCGTGIAMECLVKSSDGQLFKVGCDCIARVGDEGILKAYKTSRQYRDIQRAKAQAKSKAVYAELQSLIEANKAQLASEPHPRGFTDRQTGAPLTNLDQVQWLFQNCGATGRAALLKKLKKAFQVVSAVMA